MPRVQRVLLAQLPEQFTAALGGPITHWQSVEAAARRRPWRYDGRDTLAVHISSPSDVDDVVPTLVAYQIEWNKLHWLAREDAEARALLASPTEPDAAAWPHSARRSSSQRTTGRRLQQACGSGFWSMLRTIAAEEKDMSVGLLGGRHTSYAKLFDRWWEPVRTALATRGLARAPPVLRVLEPAQYGQSGLWLRAPPRRPALGVP